MSVFDMPLLRRRPEFFVDKFILSYDPVAYQCMEEWYDERVEKGDELFLDLNHYCTEMQKYSSLARCSWRPPRV
jgi:hypothetical protein